MDQHAFGRANECLLEDDWFSESSIPELLDDETLYSWCARFHRLNGGYDPRVTSRVLFGNPKAGLRHDIPGHMGAFQIKTRGPWAIPKNCCATEHFSVFIPHSYR